MADIYGMLDELQHRSAKEEDIKEKLLATRKEEEPFSAFCRVCRELGMRFMKWSCSVPEKNFMLR